MYIICICTFLIINNKLKKNAITTHWKYFLSILGVNAIVCHQCSGYDGDLPSTIRDVGMPPCENLNNQCETPHVSCLTVWNK